MRLSTGFWAAWLTWLAAGESYEPKVVCYFQGQAVTRIGYANFEISDIDVTLCTHLMYSNIISTEDGEVKVLSPKTDLPDNRGQAGFQKFNALRKRNEKLKTLISITNNLELFTKAGTDTQLRSKYVKNVVDFVLRHEFDGLDILWRLLTVSNEVPDYASLMKELRESFNEHNLLLSIHVTGPEVHARWYFDIPGISKYADFITLHIDSHSSMASTTGHIAPLYPNPVTTSSVELTLNTNASVYYWLSQGVPAEKLILGIRFRGLRYTLESPSKHEPGSPTIVPSKNNSSPDLVDYNEICRLTSQDTWTSAWDEEQHVPYCYGGNKWITYDNVRSAIEKGKYAKALGLGGVMAWTIDADDHQGDCGRRNPLLNALNCGIREIGCSSVPPTKTPTLTESSDHKTVPSVDGKIVCYYQSWTAIAVGYENMGPSEIDPTLCTHLIYAAVGVTGDGEIEHFLPTIDLSDDEGLAGFQKFNALRKRNENLKTLLATGSWGNAVEYSEIARNTSLRSKYVKNVVDFLLRHEFNGFAITWHDAINSEFISDHWTEYILLLKELRDSFDKRGLILSVVAHGFETGSKMYSDIPQFSKYVDFILLFCLYRQQLGTTTRYFSPLYPSSKETSSYDLSLNINATVHYWLKKGAPAEKLVVSVWFGGVIYTLDDPADHSLGSPAKISVVRNSLTWTTGYNRICRLFLQIDTWNTVWDEEQAVPYAYKDDQWVTYDDVRSLTEKARYVKAMGLGGLMTFSIDQDDHRGNCGEPFPLSKAVHCALREINCTSVQTPKYGNPSKTTSGDTFATVPIADEIATEEAKRTCARFNAKYVRDPRNCARFWICRKIHRNEITAESFSCGVGLYFDTIKVACISKNLVQCK